jgi:hypothetical protein
VSDRAVDNIGPHLLGRKAHPAELGDVSLERELSNDESVQIDLGTLSTYLADAIAALEPFQFVPIVAKLLPLLKELQHLLGTEAKEGIRRSGSLVSTLQGVIDALKPYGGTPMVAALISLLTDVMEAVGGTPPPSSPPPTPVPSTSKVWTDRVVLDQGQTGHCVGFGGSGFLASAPYQDQGINNDFGHALYYECKVNDGEPRAEDGSTVHSLAQVLVDRQRLTKYAWASTVAAMQLWVTSKGPVVMGTDWDNDMFDPDADGFVKTGGGVAGGHCYLMVGYHADTDAFEFVNSWGTGWANKGRFFMRTAEFSKLWHRSGNEAMVALELPL